MVTDAWRARLLVYAGMAQSRLSDLWPTIEELDGTDFPARAAVELARLQTDALRLTAGYVAAFARSEGADGAVPDLAYDRYAGLRRDGRPLEEALLDPIVKARWLLFEKPPEEALGAGLVNVRTLAEFEVTQAAREALMDVAEQDERFDGFHRAVAGTCTGCMSMSGKVGGPFETHPNCKCVPELRVRGASQNFTRPSGEQLFAQLTIPEQERLVGAETAAKLRDGTLLLGHLVAHEGPYIRQVAPERVEG